MVTLSLLHLSRSSDIGLRKIYFFKKKNQKYQLALYILLNPQESCRCMKNRWFKLTWPQMEKRVTEKAKKFSKWESGHFFHSLFSEMWESHLNSSLIPLPEVAPMSVNKSTRIRIWPLTFCFFWNHSSKMAFLFPSIFLVFLLPQEGSQDPQLTLVHWGRCQKKGQQVCAALTAAHPVVRKGHPGPRHAGFSSTLKNIFNHSFNPLPSTRSTESNWSKVSGRPLGQSTCPLNKIWRNRTCSEESNPKTFSRLGHLKLKVTLSEPWLTQFEEEVWQERSWGPFQPGLSHNPTIPYALLHRYTQSLCCNCQQEHQSTFFFFFYLIVRCSFRVSTTKGHCPTLPWWDDIISISFAFFWAPFLA